MHSVDVMHRDLKPENLMLMRKSDLNSLKIVDFGLATFEHSEKYQKKPFNLDISTRNVVHQVM